MTRDPEPVPLLEFRAAARAWRAGILGAAAEVTALHPCDFTLAAGEALAVTGAAGAGKSTLLMLAAGQVAPTAGVVRWCGADDPAAARPQVMGSRPWEYGFLTVRQALAFHADRLCRADPSLVPRARFVPLMASVGLRGLSRARLGHLAAIDQLRVVVAQALLAEPQLLCVEEPLGFLGPSERREAATLLRDVAARGTALLLATREERTLEALGITTRRLHLEAGRVVEQGRTGARRRDVLELRVAHAGEAMARLVRRLPSVRRRGRRLRVPLAATTAEAVLAACRDAGVVVRASRVAEEPE